MHRDLPISRWLYCGAAIFLVLPLLIVAFTDPFFGLPAFLGASARGSHWIGVVCALMIGAALWSLVRSANVIRAMWLVSLALYGQLFAFEGQPREKGPIRIVLEDHLGVSGIEVSSNGISLGKIPLVLDETEFYQRVPAWDEPPDQPAVKAWIPDDKRPRFEFVSEWYWSPGDPFQQLHEWPPDHYSWSHNEQTFMTGMAKYRYWWHFERDGFLALKRPSGLNGGGGGRMRFYQVGIGDIRFPAVPEVVKLLLEGLRESDYQPSAEWRAYVLRHRHLLFRELTAAARDDERLEPVLDRLTREWFELPEAPTEADARRALTKILDDVEADGAFTIPSVESRAIPWLAPLCPQFLAEQVQLLVRAGQWTSGGGGSAGENWQSTRAPGRTIRREPLLYALEYTQPPELFETLMLLYAKQSKHGNFGGRLLTVLAHYPRPEGIAFVRRRLQERGAFEAAIREITPLDLPEFEPEFRAAITRYTDGGKWSRESVVWKFVVERIRRGRDLSQLAEWITGANFLMPDSKVLALIEIADPRANELLPTFAAEFKNDGAVDQLANLLTAHPHPNAGRFLLDLKTWLLKSHVNTLHQSIEQAILATDSPAIRESIAETARGDLNGWIRLVSSPPKVPLTHLDWLVPLLAQSTDNKFRRESCRILSAIGTPQSKTLLDEWAHDADPKVAKVAADLVRERETAETARVTRRGQLTDLLAGRITPQDLISLMSFVWKDNTYVEKE